MYASGGSRSEGPKKNFLETPPPYLRVWMTALSTPLPQSEGLELPLYAFKSKQMNWGCGHVSDTRLNWANNCLSHIS